jgi:hypothetical protein
MPSSLIHQDFHVSFVILSAALAVTGGEAMYADPARLVRHLPAGFGAERFLVDPAIDPARLPAADADQAAGFRCCSPASSRF